MKKIIAMVCVLLMLLSMTACTPAAGDGKYVIGICQFAPHAALDAATEGFKQAVIDGLGADNVEFKTENAAGETAYCTTIINSLVSAKVDLIMANATPAVQIAANATRSIPVLGTSVTEYGLALDIDNFNGTTGTNVSGTSDLAELDQQADMLLEWFPNAKKVGLLYCASEPNSLYQVEEITKHLSQKGVTCKKFAFADSNDMAAVVRDAAAWSDVIYVPTDNAVANATDVVDSICRPAGVPVIAGEEGICAGCGVATLSISYYELGYITGQMAVKILKGEAKVSEMPIQYASTTKKYNAEICDALKLEVLEGYEKIGE